MIKPNQTFAILIWANKAKADAAGMRPLFARITIDGRRAEISLKKKVDPAKWNPDAGFMKGSSGEARVVNQYINQVKSELFEHYQQLLLKGEYVTAEAIKLRFTGTANASRKTLLEVFDHHNGQMEKLVGIDVVKATLAKFITVRKKVSEFIGEQYKKSDVYLEELSNTFLTDFDFYLKTKRGIDHNTTMRYIRNVKKIINLAVRNGWATTNACQGFKCSLRKVERHVLSPEELQLLSDKQFSIKRLEEVRDIFLFCCYTGYAFVDVEKLTKDNLVRGADGEQWIFTSRTKTNIRSNVPLLPEAFAILQKYEHHLECEVKGKLLPVKSNQKMNAYLKEIADLCGIKKPLTMHIARHTFATTVTLANGVPIETVSSMLGHTNLRTTQIYAKVVERKVSEDMKLLRQKLRNRDNA